VVGGDTTTTHANMVISVTLAGEADEHRVRLRSGAKAGDYLCVSGYLGASLAGLKILQREKDRFLKSENRQAFTPDLKPYARAIEKHLMPAPRFDVARILTGQVDAHAMIDISDGLASEVHHLCDAGGVGAEVFEHNIPVDAITQQIAGEFAEPPAQYALYGGEDYELLFTLGEEEHARLERLTSDVTIIGRITERERGRELVRENGEREPLKFLGWDHFRQ
jgi:thiamine-monophosphate kinase